QSAVLHGSATLAGGGAQFRDPLHTDDLGRLIELLYQRKVFGEKIHAGGGPKNYISFKEIVRIANPRAKIQRTPGGDFGFAFDIRKAHKLTGWEPQVLIRDQIPIIAQSCRSATPHEAGVCVNERSAQA